MRHHIRSRFRSFITIILGVLLGMATTAHATIRYVVENGAGLQTGADWDNASPSIQAMITQSSTTNGDSVWVAGGMYVATVRLDPDDPRTATFLLKNNVKIYGGFLSDGSITTFDGRNPYANVTTLSGDINGDDSGFTNNGENVYHVLRASLGVTETAILDGFTIRSGNANGDDQSQTYVTLSNSGGGILIDQAYPCIVRCKFITNFAVKGGGMHSASTVGPLGHILNIYNCIFDGNHAGSGGGGLYVAGTTQGNATHAFLVNSLVVNNVAAEDGGAIFQGCYGFTELVNSTVTKNTSTNSTHDGLYHFLPVGCAQTECIGGTSLKNCIVYNNGSSGSIDEQVFGPYSMTNSCVESVVETDQNCHLADSTSTSADPVFVSSTDFHLQSTSPCIDSGSNAVYSHPYYDDQFDVNQDGVLDEETPDLDHRVRIHGCTESGVVDMGCYEFGAVSCFGDVNGSGSVNVDDLLAVINGWGPCPSPPAACPADIMPTMCGSGTVNVDDLLLVIGNWGPCILGNSTSAEQSMPTSIQDCEDDASELYEAFTTEWNAYVNACVDALCKAQIIDCDGY